MPHLIKAENRSEKQQFLSWTRDLSNHIHTLGNVGGKFIIQVHGLFHENMNSDFLSERMSKAQTYFIGELDKKIEHAKEHLSKISKKKKIKAYKAEVRDIIEWLNTQRRQILKTTQLVIESAQGHELTKDILHEKGYYTPKIPIQVKQKNKKPTHEISLELYQQGKLPREIADYRGLVESTIITHLSKYVESGEIEPQHLISESKLKKIVTQYQYGINRAGEIKSKLGDGVSFTEIKVGLSYARWLEENGQLERES